jgi:HD-GYP domain-containing protein (c-di-GMP phosphodiesterase class II)
VLLKKGKLTDDEFEHMKQHPVIGDEIVKRVKELGPLRSGVRHHHERMDGGGYPDGLEGDAVPLLARVLAVADACDAMMSSRPYRDKRPTQEIDAIIAAGAGTHWDADVVSHFMACRQELYAMCQRGLGHTVELAVQQVLDQDGRRLGLSSIQTGLELDTGK